MTKFEITWPKVPPEGESSGIIFGRDKPGCRQVVGLLRGESHLQIFWKVAMCDFPISFDRRKELPNVYWWACMTWACLSLCVEPARIELTKDKAAWTREIELSQQLTISVGRSISPTFSTMPNNILGNGWRLTYTINQEQATLLDPLISYLPGRTETNGNEEMVKTICDKDRRSLCCFQLYPKTNRNPPIGSKSKSNTILP